MAEALRNIVVVGGSYVGRNAAQALASMLPPSHRVLLVEPHSHFYHLFAFPRFAIVPGHEHKAFIPYTALFSSAPNPSRHAVVKARVVSLRPSTLTLDREWEGAGEIPFDYLVVATGTRLTPPGSIPHNEKTSCIDYLKAYQQGLKKSKSVLIIGGGAVGVQMACDLKEVYPEKDITLLHSRHQLMPLYHEALSNLIKERFTELGISLVTGSRAIVPPTGFPADGSPFEVELENGSRIATDHAVVATGQTPNIDIIAGLESSSTDSLVNPANGFIRVRPTLQFRDPAYPHLFAVGDVADTGAHKAARPGARQAVVAATNIVAAIAGREPTEVIEMAPAGIHLTLGLSKNIIFRNPDARVGDTEPFLKWRDDGERDMGIERVWERHGVKTSNLQEYHL